MINVMSETVKNNVYPLKREHDRRNALWPQDRISRLVAILDSQPDSVIIFNSESKIIDINPSGLAMLGASSMNDVIGSRFAAFVDNIFRGVFNETLEKTFAGKTTDVEFNITALDGTRRRVSQRSAPIFSDENDNEVIEMVTVTRDVTNQYLRHMELLDAKAAADEAINVKSNFLATMSHELRTPLNAILGFSEIMKDSTPLSSTQDKFRDYANDIHDSGQHLLELIDDVLCISEIEAKNGAVIKEQLKLSDVIDQCLDTLNILADKKAIKINVNIEKDLPLIYADPKSIRQILTNLLSNAVKFSLDGQEIGLNVAAENARIFISVEDNGIGIPKQSLPELTKPFYRVEDNAEIAVPGTGLGLSIVKSLVEAHKGRLNIESVEHIGTKVTVSLPVE